MKRRIKNVKKFRSIINKNKHLIKRIISSEVFLVQLQSVIKYVQVEVKEDNEGNEELYIYNIPVILSSFILEGCVLEFPNEEHVVLSGI